MKNRHALIAGLGSGAAVGSAHAFLMNLNPTMSAVAGVLTVGLVFGLNFTYMKLTRTMM